MARAAERLLMPVRFRCAYCNQLMGISHRKMGTVVRCPKCSGQVVVPHVETAPADAPVAADREAMKLLEGPELEMLLAGAAQQSPAAKKSKRKGAPQALLEIDVEPVDLSPLRPSQEASPHMAMVESSRAAPLPKGVTLPGWVVGGMATMILLLLGLIFLLGFLLGRQTPK